MMSLLKKLHKWIGLLIGIQVLLWLLSGLIISLLDPAKVSGKQWASTTAIDLQTLEPAVPLEPADLPSDVLKEALGITLTTRHGKPVYLIRHTGGESLVDANDGSLIVIDRINAEKLARQDFSGEGETVSTQGGMAPDRETRNHQGAYWRVDFSDTSHTAIYVSVSTGEILERRNNYWRVRDFFWMLHIMDYPGRENFNNPLIISVALVAIWLGVSGFLLLFSSFSRFDFFFLNVSGKRDHVIITLIDPTHGHPQKVKLRKNSNLFLSLATHEVNLPSICGGGGECGKCRVRFETGGDLPGLNDIELKMIPRRLLEQGARLACQQRATGDTTLHLRAGTLESG